MTGVSLFLGYSLYKAQVEIAQLETRVTQNVQTIVTPDEELSWEVSNQDNISILKIQGINKSERQPDQICVLLVKNEENKENEFYLSQKKRTDKDNCRKPSLVIPDREGQWNLEHTFTEEKSRTIRVEKIYSNTSDSYIDFTIGEGD
ncbi:MAG: hypothetical protein SWJ54_10135 [Cyanobacteriota bacterium]|nr:hypothetical protein [Cyanobacteriota bacterium]